MINIYSIKEVIEASNNILNRSKNEKVIQKKLRIVQNFFEKRKPLILIDEISAEKEIKFNSDESNTKKWQTKISLIKKIK